ncbi:ABC transporter ATP-binding protein [Actinorugispora endophytica]|uniref:Fluoroquinolone transport system ATP-binding protein n=1 Tax=Actinorugispora endophytica TaxID=1605990 RepID=A0A4R6UGB1_9ACTN|nr:ABC transporter ATP-binding protein [Actinorugispora endophytica]TDQ44253.1 fluoroquinolone transport system ATP-binding protein [Actinorugispora endophytica]
MSGPAIDVAALNVRYPGSARAAVRDMSFTVRSGEVFGFLGPSGAGKSSTQRVLTRLLRDYQGRVAVLGRPLEDWGSDLYQRIGVGFELPAYFGRLTARENLAAFAALYRGPTADVDELLERVDLADAAGQRAGTLSKGMRMRLNLARALVNQPELLFLDEPTSGQDPVRAAMLRDLVREQADQGRTVFLTTHDMATADQLCDRVAFVVDGRIAAVDSPRGFRLGHGRAGVVVEYRGDAGPARREFSVADLAQDPAFAELARQGRVETVHSREASLDEVFAAVTRKAL